MRAGNTYRAARKRAAKVAKLVWRLIPAYRIRDNSKGTIVVKHWPQATASK